MSAVISRIWRKSGLFSLFLLPLLPLLWPACGLYIRLRQRFQLTWTSAIVLMALPISSLLLIIWYIPLPWIMAAILGLPFALLEAILILEIWAFAKCAPYLLGIWSMRLAVGRWQTHLRATERRRRRLSRRIQKLNARYGKAFQELGKLQELINNFCRIDLENLNTKVLSWQADLHSRSIWYLRRERKKAVRALCRGEKDKALWACVLRQVELERRLAERLAARFLWQDALALCTAEAETINEKLRHTKQAIEQMKAAYRKARTGLILLD